MSAVFFPSLVPQVYISVKIQVNNGKTQCFFAKEGPFLSCVLEKFTTGIDLKKCSESYFVCPNLHTNVLSAGWLPDAWATFLTPQIKVNMLYNWDFPKGKAPGEICVQMSMFSVFQCQEGLGGSCASCCLPSIVQLKSPQTAPELKLNLSLPLLLPSPQAERL